MTVYHYRIRQAKRGAAVAKRARAVHFYWMRSMHKPKFRRMPPWAMFDGRLQSPRRRFIFCPVALS
jgi:hypothetical protein